MTVAKAQAPGGGLMRFAAIDIGTVTSRLLVADTDGVAVQVVAREYEVTNLGEGVDATGLITQAALERVAAAVDRFIQVRNGCSLPDLPVLGTVVMATSAARDAQNADAFAQMLAERGLELQVISGQREAELTFAGVTIEASSGTSVAAVDVGGGSTEVSFGVAGQGMSAARSFDVGCRRMTERFLHADPPTAAQLDAARAWAVGQFEAWHPSSPASCTLYAVAGTATSAIAMHKGLRVYDSSQVHGATMTRDQLQRQLESLARMSAEERQHVIGLDPRRAPVIVAGLVILTCVMDVFGFSAFTASESDILQGMILWAAKSHVRGE